MIPGQINMCMCDRTMSVYADGCREPSESFTSGSRIVFTASVYEYVYSRMRSFFSVNCQGQNNVAL